MNGEDSIHGCAMAWKWIASESSIFGQTVMVNAAHASDSEENARREIGIVNVGENNFREVIEEFYGKV